jgi:dipeptidyl aminopeptidase/acylaminoacyl peptidase
MMKMRYFVLFLVALILSGCGNAQPTAIPTIRFEPKFTPTTTPTPTNDPSPVPSRTPAITLTPAPSNTTDSTQYAEETSAPLTEEAQSTLNAAFSYTCYDNYAIDRFSPDKKWKVLSCEEEDIPKMVVENQSGTIWKLKYEDFLSLSKEEKERGIAVSANLYPIHWSPDGDYLYFTSYGGAEGGGTCFYGFGVQGMFRLELQTGKVSTILALLPPDDWNGYQVAFSPTGRRFSYSRGYAEGKNSFHLVDVLTGEETTFATEQQNGTFRWSPDGASLAYSTSLCTNDPQSVIRSFIKILNIADLSTRTIAQSDTDFLTIDDWSAKDNLLTIERESYVVNEITTLSLDPNKSIVISSASPTP